MTESIVYNPKISHDKFRLTKRNDNLSGSSTESCGSAARNFSKLAMDIEYQDYIRNYESFPYVEYNPKNPGPRILNVFNENLVEGMKKLREFSKISKYVAIDTEFPGTIIKISPEKKKSADIYYHNVKVNTDILKPIQIGFSFFDENGKPVSNQSTVQFNFQWNRDSDVGNSDSIKLLHHSGIEFTKLVKHGIDPDHFAELFITTGLVMNEDIIWIGFHSSHDWAYILKIVTGWEEMPSKFADFQTLLQIHFPKTIDLKTLALKCKLPGCGLQDLSQMMQVAREGYQHQAGSDSKLTGETYFKLVEKYVPLHVVRLEWYNQIYGLNYCAYPWHTGGSGGSDDNCEASSFSSSDRLSPLSGDASPDDEINSNDD